MLIEAILYATTRVPKSVRKLGYLVELIGIRARITRCRSAWRPHWKQCHKVILTWANDLPKRDRVVVMGAALCNDIPLRALSELFDEVILVDLVHPWWAWRSRRSNIRCLTMDVTGTLETIYEKRNLVEPNTPDLPEADLYLSVNLASQLPCVSGDWLMDQGIDEQSINTWSAQVITNHFLWVSALPGAVGLITEIEEQTRKNGKILERRDPLYGADRPKMREVWSWFLAPEGEVYPDREIVLRVGAARLK